MTQEGLRQKLICFVNLFSIRDYQYDSEGDVCVKFIHVVSKREVKGSGESLGFPPWKSQMFVQNPEQLRRVDVK